MDKLRRLARVIQERNAIDKEIASIINNEALNGNIAEYIVEQVFGVERPLKRNQKTSDGFIPEGLLKGKTVNTKYSGKSDRWLNIIEGDDLDYYIVIKGLKSDQDAPFTIERAFPNS